MKLSRDEVLKLARLSRLKLSEEEIATFQKELGAILEYVKQLDDADVANLKPTYQVTGLTSADPHVVRRDEVTPQLSQKELLKNVPRTKDGLIEVKRMVG